MAHEPAALLLIFCMGLATYATRLAGYWLLRGKVMQGRQLAAVQAVPPAILTAVIAPAVFLNGPADMLAGAITLAAALKKLPLLLVIAIGMASAAILRHFM